MTTMTKVKTWARENLNENDFKMCLEDLNSDHTELWTPWIDRFEAFNKKEIIKSQPECTPDEYRAMVNHAPHGSNYKKIEVKATKNDRGYRINRLVFSFEYNGELCKTETTFRGKRKIV